MDFLGFTTAANAQKYFGKTYAATQNVGEFYDLADVKVEYTVMGTTELGQGFRSLKKVQEKIIEQANEKVADGVIFKVVEEVTGASTIETETANTKNNKKSATFVGGSTTTETKLKKLIATYIKYV